MPLVMEAPTKENRCRFSEDPRQMTGVFFLGLSSKRFATQWMARTPPARYPSQNNIFTSIYELTTMAMFSPFPDETSGFLVSVLVMPPRRHELHQLLLAWNQRTVDAAIWLRTHSGLRVKAMGPGRKVTVSASTGRAA